MDIVPARGLAPFYLFVRRFKLHEANGTVAADLLPLALSIRLGGTVRRIRRDFLEYFTKFL